MSATTTPTAAMITARLDRLPASREIWKLVILLSLGGMFELYDLLMTGYVAPGLVRSGIFSPGHTGLFGLPDQAAFASITFAGLFVGTIGFGYVADRFGRRNVFTWALLWYSICTVVMASQSSVLGIDLWRFIAGVGVGVELVTIDTYIAELVPKQMRGRAFTVNQVIQFCSVPTVALLSWLLVPIDPFGIAGWRFVAAFPAIAAVLVFFIIRIVPESPRWLAQHGRLAEADRITSAIEARVAAEKGPLPAPAADGCRGARQRRLQRDLATAVSPPHHHVRGVQHLPDHRLLRLRQLGPATARRARCRVHQEPAVFLHHRARQSDHAAAVPVVRRQGRTQMADLRRGDRRRGVRGAVLAAEQRACR